MPASLTVCFCLALPAMTKTTSGSSFSSSSTLISSPSSNLVLMFRYDGNISPSKPALAAPRAAGGMPTIFSVPPRKIVMTLGSGQGWTMATRPTTSGISTDSPSWSTMVRVAGSALPATSRLACAKTGDTAAHASSITVILVNNFFILIAILLKFISGKRAPRRCSFFLPIQSAGYGR